MEKSHIVVYNMYIYIYRAVKDISACRYNFYPLTFTRFQTVKPRCVEGKLQFTTCQTTISAETAFQKISGNVDRKPRRNLPHIPHDACPCKTFLLLLIGCSLVESNRVPDPEAAPLYRVVCNSSADCNDSTTSANQPSSLSASLLSFRTFRTFRTRGFPFCYRNRYPPAAVRAPHGPLKREPGDCGSGWDGGSRRPYHTDIRGGGPSRGGPAEELVTLYRITGDAVQV